MRIGIEAQRIFRRKKHGMDIVALESLRHLQQFSQQPGHEHEYVVFVKPGEDPCLASSENLFVYELDAPSYPVWEQVALPQAAKKAGVDVLHCTSNTAPLNSPVPTVVTVHDVIYLEGRASAILRGSGTWYQRLGNLYRRQVVPSVAHRAAKVLTVSEYERRRILDTLPMPAEKLDVVYNGVGAHFRPVESADEQRRVRQRYGLPEDFLFFLGNTDPKKNLPCVITAYVEYARSVALDDRAPTPLVIADYAREALDVHLRALDALDLAPRFILPGYMANTDLPAIYSQAALFLYPSLRESFGIPILEAMACGAPVITSRAASMPEVAGDAAVLIEPTQPSSLASAIRHVLADATLQADLRRQGFARAERFSWARTAERLVEIYEEVAGAPVPAAVPNPVAAEPAFRLAA
ncbi:MAG: glycosyltransferase family 1 protein [Bacteroidota bacterium]